MRDGCVGSSSLEIRWWRRAARRALVLVAALLASAALAAEGAAPPGSGRGGPPENQVPAGAALERQVAQRLAHLDERLGLGTFPNGSPQWPARMAAALEHLLASPGAGAELPARVLLRRLGVELRQLGAARGLGGPPEEPGRPPEPPGKERAERLGRLLETVRLLHEKLDQAEGSGSPGERLAPLVAPTNDDCAAAQAIGLGTFTGTTAQATNDGSATCGSSASSPDVWYVFTAPTADTYVFDTFGSSYDTVLSLLTGCGGSELGCNDDADGTLNSKLTRTLAAGESVHIRVSGFGGDRGAYTLNVSRVDAVFGTVTRADTGVPLSGVAVDVYNDFGGWVTGALTAADGTYSVPLSAGTYYLRTRSSGFIDELYDGIACPFYVFCWPNDGTPVTVGPGGAAGIDFALDPAASLSGTITDAATAGPLSGFVYLYGATGTFLDSYFTGSDGTYEAVGLPSGKYYLQADAWDFRSELYDDIPCEGFCDPTSGTSIIVATGEALGGLDFALDRHPSIAGTLTEEGSGDPIAGQEIDLFGSGGGWVDWDFTSSDGSYRFDGVAPGSYFVRTSTDDHLDELYDDLPCEPSCSVTSGTVVEAVLGSETTGIDFVLVPKGKMAGTVTEAGFGSPLSGVAVWVYRASGSFLRSASTLSDGTYVVPGLATGTYYVRTGSGAYENELYDGLPCQPSCDVTAGTPVATTDGTTTSGIDFALVRRGSIAGRVSRSTDGSPVSGADIRAYSLGGSFITSAWTGSDGTYTLQDMASGSYYLVAHAWNHQGEIYDDIPCTGSCNPAQGVPVAVQSDTTTSAIDFALDRLGFVEGRVTAAGTGQPLASDLYLLNSAGTVVVWAWTSNGEFRIEGVPAGTYYVKTDTSWSSPSYQDELFDDVPCEPDCDLSLGTPLPVQLNGGVVGVNLALGTCPASSYEDLLNTTILSTYTAEACERVSGTGVTVKSGADVTFKAGRTVVLGDGFKVEEGGTFRAVIEPAWAEH